MSRTQKRTLLKDAAEAYRKGNEEATKDNDFFGGRQNEMTYEDFAKAYREEKGDYFFKQDEPFLPALYEHLTNKLNAGLDRRSSSERGERKEERGERNASGKAQGQALVKGEKWASTGVPEKFKGSKKSGDSHDITWYVGKKKYGSTTAERDLIEALTDKYGNYTNVWNAYENGEFTLGSNEAAILKASLEAGKEAAPVIETKEDAERRIAEMDKELAAMDAEYTGNIYKARRLSDEISSNSLSAQEKKAHRKEIARLQERNKELHDKNMELGGERNKLWFRFFVEAESPFEEDVPVYNMGALPEYLQAVDEGERKLQSVDEFMEYNRWALAHTNHPEAKDVPALVKLVQRVLQKGRDYDKRKTPIGSTEERAEVRGIYASEKKLLEHYRGKGSAIFIDDDAKCVYTVDYRPAEYKGRPDILIVRKEYFEEEGKDNVPANEGIFEMAERIANEEEAKKRKPTLANVIKTLYEKGKDAASKQFERTFLDVAKTPDFMKEYGLTGDKFTIRYGVISRHFGKDGSHDFTESEWTQLPEALQHPFAITRLDGKDAGYRIYTSLKTEKGEYVVVGVDVKNAGRDLEVNAISTVFGRRNNANLPTKENVVYKSETITPEQSSLLERPNSAQYPTAREVSAGKVTSKTDAAQGKGKKKSQDAPKAEKPKNASGNKLVTDERYEELKKRMRAKLLGQMNMGVDPEILAIGTEMAVYHIEKGARKFAEYAKGMIADMGDAIRPYLKAFYEGAKNMPEVEENGWYDEMTPSDEVRKFDVANFSSEESGEEGAEVAQAKTGYTIEQTQYTTKRGKVLDMQLVQFDFDEPSQMDAAKAIVKDLKGWYDKERGGFLMRSEEDVQKLLDALKEQGIETNLDNYDDPLSPAGDKGVPVGESVLEKADRIAAEEEKKRKAKAKDGGPREVDVEGFFNAVKQGNEVRLSDFHLDKSYDDVIETSKRAFASQSEKALKAGVPLEQCKY